MRDFDPSESMENVGILDVFPIFHTARLGQKIRRSPQLPLCGVALYSVYHFLWKTQVFSVMMFSIGLWFFCITAFQT